MRTLAEVRVVGWCAVAAVAMLGLAGCGGDGPRIYQLSGTLTYKGTALPNMGVTFQPADGSRPSFGETDASGRFKLRYTGTEDGVQQGEHVVFVEYKPGGDEGMAYMEGRLKLTGDIKAVIEKYGSRDRSPYRITVDADMENAEIKLD